MGIADTFSLIFWQYSMPLRLAQGAPLNSMQPCFELTDNAIIDRRALLREFDWFQNKRLLEPTTKI